MKPAARLIQIFTRGSWALGFAFTLLILALVIPTVKWPRNTYDYMIVFDISQSMNVEDYELAGTPVSRLRYARDAARSAIRKLPCGSRVGWAAFTGYRTMLLLAPVEVCENYNDLLASLEKIDGGMRWSEASEISKGLYWAVRAAEETESTPNVVFLTDGQEAPPIDAGMAPPMLSDLKGSAIRGWIIGTGGYAPSPIPKVDEEGRRKGYWRSYEVIQSTAPGDESKVLGEHLSGLREPHLQTLAKLTGFEYARLNDANTLRMVLRDERFARKRPVETDIKWLPLSLALLMLSGRFCPTRSSARRKVTSIRERSTAISVSNS